LCTAVSPGDLPRIRLVSPLVLAPPLLTLLASEENDMRRTQPLTALSRPRALESEEMLLLAVLEQAIADLNDPCPAVRADALAYIYSYDGDYSIFSFDSVCAYFKLSAPAVRRALQTRIRVTHPIPTTYETAA
jgi:hypothetical protein